jgi:hypothetical protein
MTASIRTIVPTSVILPEYTDEALQKSIAGGGVWGPDVAAVFLRVPAEWRQPIEAAATQETSRIEFTPSGHSSEMMMNIVVTGDVHAARARLVDDFLASHP